MNTIKSTGLAALAVLALGVAPVALQQSQARRLDTELASLRQRISQPAPGRSIHDRRDSGESGAAGRPAPVARFLAEMQRPLDADGLIEQLVSATMSQDMGRIMRVLIPLARLSPAEG